jgi:hypothetical protein
MNAVAAHGFGIFVLQIGPQLIRLLISQISTVALSVNAVRTSGDKFLQIANPLKGNNLLSGLLANSEFSKCQ